MTVKDIHKKYDISTFLNKTRQNQNLRSSIYSRCLVSKQTHELTKRNGWPKNLYVTLNICFLLFCCIAGLNLQHLYLTTNEYTQINTDLHIQTNKQKRGSCNPQYVLISFADIKSLQIYLQQRAYRKIKNRS